MNVICPTNTTAVSDTITLGLDEDVTFWVSNISEGQDASLSVTVTSGAATFILSSPKKDKTIDEVLLNGARVTFSGSNFTSFRVVTGEEEGVTFSYTLCIGQPSKGKPSKN
jgi:hypothetical protein